MLALLATSCCRCSGWCGVDEETRGPVLHVRAVVRPHFALLSNIRADLHPRRRRLRHGGCSTPCSTRSVSAAGPRCWPPPPATASPSTASAATTRCSVGARLDHGADHRAGHPDVPAVQQGRPGQHAVGDHPALAGQPVRPVPDAGLRGGRRPGQPHRGGPHRRRRRVPDLLPVALRLLAPGLRDRAAVHPRGDLEQLLPAAHHAQRPEPVPDHRRARLLGSADRRRRQRREQRPARLVVTGSMLSVVPLIAAFLLLQRYWQSGLAAGGVKE
jgi:hypothetical protein